MNTVSTDLLPEVAEAIEAAKATLAEREQQYREAERRRHEDEQAKRREAWAQPLATLLANLPAWIHPYVVQSDTYYGVFRNADDEYSYVIIQVPDCNPIAAWVFDNKIVYEPFRPYLDHDDDTGAWFVRNSLHNNRRIRSQNGGEPDIAVALFEAHEAMIRRLDLEAVAEERNTPDEEPETLLVPADEPDPEPEPKKIADPIDQARELIAMFSDGEKLHRYPAGTDECGEADDRTLVQAAVGIAIAYHISRVADALERQQWS